MDLISRYKLNKIDNWTNEIFRPPLIVCPIKILLVTDGASFTASGGYSLSLVIEAINHHVPPYIRIEITTAHHGSRSPIGDSDISDFRFNEHNLEMYDQIWIFAVQRGVGSALNPGEMSAIWEFMQDGGGVFATGDHDSLGVALCGGIPRVRSMRRWHYGPGDVGPNGEPDAPNAGSTRNDSKTGASTGDGIPQTIRPKMYSTGGPTAFTRRKYPHPVLCSKLGVITKLPDHMHEGLIEVPADLNMPIQVDGVAVTEYPNTAGSQLSPEVIAHSTINDNPDGEPFGVIGAYDGHLIDSVANGVGRIVVDATWHHFWTGDLNQYHSVHESVSNAIANGLTPDPSLVETAEAWEEIRDYFQNIAFWLARKSTQACIRRRGMLWVSRHVDVLMVLNERHSSRSLNHWYQIGVKARDALQQIAPACEVLRFQWHYVDLRDLLLPWRPLPTIDPPDPRRLDGLLDHDMLGCIVLGAQVQAMTNLSDGIDENAMAKFLDQPDISRKLATIADESIVLFSQELNTQSEVVKRFARSRAKTTESKNPKKKQSRKVNSKKKVSKKKRRTKRKATGKKRATRKRSKSKNG